MTEVETLREEKRLAKGDRWKLAAEVVRLGAKVAAAEEDRDYFKTAYTRKLADEAKALEAAQTLCTERDSLRGALEDCVRLLAGMLAYGPLKKAVVEYVLARARAALSASPGAGLTSAVTVDGLLHGGSLAPPPAPAQGGWLVRLICCGKDDGVFAAATWDEADRFRASYVGAQGHDRTAIIDAAPPAPAPAQDRVWIGEVRLTAETLQAAKAFPGAAQDRDRQGAGGDE